MSHESCLRHTLRRSLGFQRVPFHLASRNDSDKSPRVARAIETPYWRTVSCFVRGKECLGIQVAKASLLGDGEWKEWQASAVLLEHLLLHRAQRAVEDPLHFLLCQSPRVPSHEGDPQMVIRDSKLHGNGNTHRCSTPSAPCTSSRFLLLMAWRR